LFGQNQTYKPIAKGFHLLLWQAIPWRKPFTNMLKTNNQNFRSLKGAEMKKIKGGVAVAGCPASACVFRGSYCQIVQGTCGGSDGDCYCVGGGEFASGCSAKLDDPWSISTESASAVA
jgi:hypothetical protein